MLWLGKKIFKFREKLIIGRGLMAEDEEKPFLDHLEDLRKTLMKIIITLVVAMIACFAFNRQLFMAARYPIAMANVDIPDDAHLPKGFASPEDWPVVIGIAHGLIGLDEGQRQTFLSHALAGDRAHLAPYVQALLFHHAALDLPKEARPGYLAEATKGDVTLLALVQEMADRKIDASFERGPQKVRMFFSGPAQGFNLSMKLALYAGVVVAFPLLLYFLLEFIVPGLKREERRVLWPSMAVGFGLFLVGISFAYLVVTPKALRFFVNYDRELGGASDYRMPDYVSFVIQFTLIFGLCFELPVIVFALNKLGILSYQLMRRTRSYAVIVIVIVAAIITPTADLLNLSLLVIPMLILYEISIWIAYFQDRRERRAAEAETAEAAARRAAHRPSNMAAGYLEPPDEHGGPAHPETASDPSVDPADGLTHTVPFEADHSPDGHGFDSTGTDAPLDPFHGPGAAHPAPTEPTHPGEAAHPSAVADPPLADPGTTGPPEGERHRD